MSMFKALRIHQDQQAFHTQVANCATEELPEVGVLIRVHYSALNYKDMLAMMGHKGIAERYPHTPGIDAAGIVVESQHADYRPGDAVIVTGFELGTRVWGGLSELIRVPGIWIVRCPEGLSLFDAMAYGTAGLTAAMCVDSLLQVGVSADLGPVAVSGATGGVGCLAVNLLAKLGFEVIALTRKVQAQDFLKSQNFLRSIGAQQVLDTTEFATTQTKALLKERWIGAVDCVGGDVLMNILKSTIYGGSVACCGMALSAEFNGSVYPFILRGINLLGIDCAQLPIEVRLQLWTSLSNEWRLADMDKLVTTITLSQVADLAANLQEGQLQGRYVVDLRSA
jgi:alcohol dehydrogenase